MESIHQFFATARLGLTEIASRLSPGHKRPRSDVSPDAAEFAPQSDPAPLEREPASPGSRPSEPKRMRRQSAPAGILRDGASAPTERAPVFPAADRASALPPELNGFSGFSGPPSSSSRGGLGAGLGMGLGAGLGSTGRGAAASDGGSVPSGRVQNPFSPLARGGVSGSALDAVTAFGFGSNADAIARPKPVWASGRPPAPPRSSQLFVSPTQNILQSDVADKGRTRRGGSFESSGSTSGLRNAFGSGGMHHRVASFEGGGSAAASVRARAYSVRQTALDMSARKRSARKYRNSREVRRLSFGGGAQRPTYFGTPKGVAGTPTLDVTGKIGTAANDEPMKGSEAPEGATPQTEEKRMFLSQPQRHSAVGGGGTKGEPVEKSGAALVPERNDEKRAAESRLEEERLEEQRVIQCESRKIAARVASLERAAGPLPPGLASKVNASPGLAGAAVDDGDVQLTGVYPALSAGSTTQHLLRQYPPDFVEMMDAPLFREKMERARVNIPEFATYDKRREERQKRLHLEQEKLAKLRAESLLRQRQLDGDFDVDKYVHQVQEAARGALRASSAREVDEPGEDSLYDIVYTGDDGFGWNEEEDLKSDPEKRTVTVEDPSSAFSGLTETALRRVRYYMGHTGPERQLITINRIPIGTNEIHRLAPQSWLNDEVINAYMELIKARSGRFEEQASKATPSNGKSKPKVHVFNTFFYPKLSGCNSTGVYDYSGVRRWTKRVDVFAHDFAIVPVNSANIHWTLAVINFREKRVEYFDSMGSTNNKVMANLLRWLSDELENKKGEVFDPSVWSTVGHGKDVPQQNNSDDCGVFLCKFADFISRGAELNFSAVHMKYFRARMANELLVGHLA